MQAERISINEAARKRNIERLLDGLNIPARFENCTLQNYEPVNEVDLYSRAIFSAVVNTAELWCSVIACRAIASAR